MNTYSDRGSEFFQWILQCSWQAAVLAGLILLVQWLFRKRLSPEWRYGLWLLLVLRLLMPVSPQAAFSVFNLARLAKQAPSGKDAKPATGSQFAPRPASSDVMPPAE